MTSTVGSHTATSRIGERRTDSRACGRAGTAAACGSRATPRGARAPPAAGLWNRRGRLIRGFRLVKAGKKAGIPGPLFHDLRRSAIRSRERAGVPRSVAVKLTGHRTESIRRRYAIVAESHVARRRSRHSAVERVRGSPVVRGLRQQRSRRPNAGSSAAETPAPRGRRVGPRPPLTQAFCWTCLLSSNRNFRYSDRATCRCSGPGASRPR